MKSALLSLVCCICYSTSQTASPNRQLPKSPCDGPNKSSLVGVFFNTIFTEFHSTPPVCVCVQMCTAQPTYCYPIGCLKAAIAQEKEKSKKMVEKTPPKIRTNEFALVKDDMYDFVTDLRQRNYVDETKAPTKINNRVQDLRPDPFKDKYSILGKYKKVPKVELRYNLQEKVKNAKLDSKKIEGLAKTKWSMNRNNKIKGVKLFSDVGKPLKAHAAFFTEMLPDREIAEYPPKYFKRDLKKAIDPDNVNPLKAYYVLDNSLNATESLSLETLIDNLVQSSFGPAAQNDTTVKLPITKRGEAENETKATIENVVTVNSTVLANETTRVISINFTNENVDKNKYADDSFEVNKTADVNEMIVHFAKQIELQNNTSMEIARRTISNYNEATLNTNKDDLKLSSTLHSTELHPSLTTVNNSTELESTVFTTHTEQETTTFRDIIATKKNRQKVVKKFAKSKAN